MCSGLLHQQDLEERAQERLAAPLGVVHELEKREVEREQLLRDPAMWTQPGAKQGPEPFDRVDMDFMEAVPVVVSRVLTPAVADALVGIAPLFKSGVDVVLVGVNQTATLDDRSDEWFNGRLLHVFEHPDEHVAGTLQDAENRWLLFVESPSPRGSF
jgi:hypothetical protein